MKVNHFLAFLFYLEALSFDRTFNCRVCLFEEAGDLLAPLFLEEVELPFIGLLAATRDLFAYTG